MKEHYKYILENVSKGKIEKQVAIEILTMLKTIDRKKNSDLGKATKEDIAVIGMAVKLPMADSAEEFWDNIRNGVDCISDFPASRRGDIDLAIKAMYSSLENVHYDIGAFLNEIDKFDYSFFKLSPKEASLMDPNQRLLLQTTVNAIENAGYGGTRITGTRTGVYVGYSSDFGESYKTYTEWSENSFTGFTLTGNIKSILAGRISYTLDLKGPSIVVDTACSSALVAVHLACQGLRIGDCDMAVAGGVKINLLQLKTDSSQRIGIESSTGRARTFDDSSDGTGFGEGVAVVFLKPLNKAIDDGDIIHAVIKGTAVNQDGSSNGITAPNSAAQEDVILQAWKDADIEPETITYIEAHGTGTRLGDPIEVEGIRRAFGKHTQKKQFCGIGSVKTNIGHLDNAAGIAGLIKLIMALKNRQLPPSLHFVRPNKHIDFENSPVYICDRLTLWETEGIPRRCGVSSFGLSGTNCHIVLEEAPERKKITEENQPGIYLLALSAQYQEGIIELIKRYQEAIDNEPDINLNNLCIIANTGRGHYSHRLIVIFTDATDLKQKLESIIAAEALESASIKNVYYGMHKVVVANKEHRDEGEYTENEIKNLTNSINAKIKELDIKDGPKYESLLEKICFSYIQGANIDWSEFYRGQKYHKISIPTYPFQKIRCWVEYTERNDQGRFNQLTSGKDTFYHITWVPCDLKKEEVAQKQGSVLVFKEQNLLAETIIQALKDHGKEIIEVSLGKKYCQIDNNTYAIDNTEDSYKKLIANLKEYYFSQIIHLQTLSNNKEIEGIHQLEEFQQKGVYSLFYLTRALLSNRVKEELDIVLISDYVHEVTKAEEIINPQQASLFGLGKVATQEYPKLHCRCIDIDQNTNVNEIMLELEYGKGVYQVAYRNGRRFVEEFQELDLNNLSDQDIRIQSEGVYLITGGAGGIGLEIGKYLATKNKVKLALLNRSILPERKTWDEIIEKNEDRKLINIITAIQEMEKAGSEVSCYSADVSNFDEVKLILDELRQKYGKINGVIHSAGVAGDGFLFIKDEKVFRNVLAPKVRGTWVLDQLTRNDNLDFFIMFSSITSLLGGAGQGDYTAANSFLDTYASYRARKGKKTLTINWPAWKETGMAVEFGVNQDDVFQAILTKQALKSFDKALNRDIDRVFIGALNKNGFSKDFPIQVSDELQIKLTKVTNGDNQRENSIDKKVDSLKISGKGNNEYSVIEKVIAKIWASILGLNTIDIYDSFNSLGGNSILAVKLHKELEIEFPGLIDIADIFTYSTINGMAEFLTKTVAVDKKLISAVENDDLDEFLERLAKGEITEEQVDKLF